MSLYGALFGGVSGLKSQASKIGVISDNIANVNTIGYKAGQAQFETLVVSTTAVSQYQTGGVRPDTRYLVDKQGLLQSTDAPTDIAISGKGFFTVNQKADGSNQPLYTRAGSFRQDNQGNFVNAAGFYLQGWPLDREGRLPGTPGNVNTTSFANLDSLSTVNVETQSGVAAATTQVQLGINLNAGEVIFPGQAGVLDMDALSANNFNRPSDSIIVPDEYGLAPVNSIYRGDRFRVTTGAGQSFDYEYGGFSIGRRIDLAGTTNAGDSQTFNAASIARAAGTVVTGGAGSQTVNVNTLPAGHNLVPGDTVTFAGLGIIDGVDYNNTTFTVTSSTATTAVLSFTGPGLPTVGAVANVPVGTMDIYPFAGNIFDATNANQAFFGTYPLTRIASSALSFTIATPTKTATFTYTSGSPNAFSGQFNTLNNLATAINEVNGLTARVVNGRLIVGSENASESVTFTNGNSTGTVGSLRGLDWVNELGLSNVTSGSRRFSTLASLETIVDADPGVTATISNPLSSATMEINVDDPLDTITFADVGIAPRTIAAAGTPFQVPAAAANTNIDIVVLDAGIPTTLNVGDRIIIQNETAGLGGLPGSLPNTPPLQSWQVTAVVPGVSYTFRIPAAFNTAGVAGGNVNGSGNATISILNESNQGSLVSELGLTASRNSALYTPQTTGVLGPKYDSSGVVGDNMASGDITAQFSRNAQIFDALGTGHDIRFSYIKTAQNRWAVEVHAIPETDVNTTLVNGQIAVGTIDFNGDGSLRSVSASLSNPINITWTNGAAASTVTINWGTAGQPFGTAGATVFGDTNGLSQFDSDYNVAFIEQNGSPVGQLVSVSIDEDGFVIAAYSNGETQRLYKLPIADFNNPNGLRNISGNVYAETSASGEVNLREAGDNGVGTVVSAALEASNVDLSEQLTDMIVAQRAYQANTRVISTTDELLEQLNNL